MSDNNSNNGLDFDAIMAQSGLSETGYAEAAAALDAHVAEIAAKSFKPGDRVTHKQGGPVQTGTVVKVTEIPVLDETGMHMLPVAIMWHDDCGPHAVKQKNLRKIVG